MYGSHNMRHVDFRGLTGSQQTPGFWGVTEPMFPLVPPSEKKLKTKELSMKAAAHITAGVKELLLLDPP